MKILRNASVLLVMILLVGCGDDDPVALVDEGITIADLVGSWTATSNTYTNNANAAETFELISNGGEVRVTVLADGGTRTWVDFDTVLDEWDSAATVNGATITSVPVEAGRPTRVWTFTLVNGILTLTDATSEWDFTLSGATPVSATEVVVLVRN